MKKFALCAFLGFLVIGCGSVGPNSSHNTYSENEQDDLKREPGKCYAKCMIPDENDKSTNFIFLYNGTEEYPQFVEKQGFVTQSSETKWVKKKADRNCRSADPNDCLVWCLEEAPKIIEIKLIVTDTSLQQNYIKEYLTSTDIVEGEVITEWREVLCSGKVSSQIVIEIQFELSSRGIYNGDLTGEFDNETGKALKEFQKKNELAIGGFTRESIEFLELEFPE